MRQCRRWKKET